MQKEPPAETAETDGTNKHRMFEPTWKRYRALLKTNLILTSCIWIGMITFGDHATAGAAVTVFTILTIGDAIACFGPARMRESLNAMFE